MKISFFKYLFLLSFLTIIFHSCVKKETYPTSPVIEYSALYPYLGDSAIIQIKFTDGYGDIGVSGFDSTRTLWITYYYKDTITQKFIGYYRSEFNDTLKTGYIVNEPSDSYKGKPISGEISVKMQQLRHSKKIKNIKYVIYLFDKAGNKSNIVTTPEFYFE